MDLDLFVQCAARITAIESLSFQGLILLMFLSGYTVRPICLLLFLELSFLKGGKKQYQLKTVWY